MPYRRPHGLMDVFAKAVELSGDIEPLTYLEDHGNHFLVSMDLPMVKKEDLQVVASAHHLEISARVATRRTYSDGGVSGETYQSASFRKAISLPQAIDPEKAKAVFQRGILAIELPKKVEKRRLDIE